MNASIHAPEIPGRESGAEQGDGQERGKQRLSVDQLQAWQQLEYGMFLHFGMSTYDGEELSDGSTPAKAYAPDRLDVDQWVQVARDAGMRYAVLTAKHTAGFALWPSRHTDYHVGNSGCPTDVVEQFVKACERHGVKPGLYYCSWDNHHTFGSLTRSNQPEYIVPQGDLLVTRPLRWQAYTTAEYHAFQLAQVEELLTQYGPIEQVWIDIPGVLPHDARIKQYEQIASLQPSAKVTMNHGGGDGMTILLDRAWPTDVLTLERHVPASPDGYQPWKRLSLRRGEVEPYYIPAEMCDTLGREWFHAEGDRVRSDAELLAMRLLCRERGANLLLNVAPDRSGMIEEGYAKALDRLRKNVERVGG